MIGVYLVGYALAMWYSKLVKLQWLSWAALVFVGVYYHVVLKYVGENVGFTETSIMFLKLLIVVAIFVSMGLVRRVQKNTLVNRIINWVNIPGRASLVFFTAINVMVSVMFIVLPKESISMWMMWVVGGVAYGLSWMSVKRVARFRKSG
jgi:hypothetical protein